MRLLGVGSVDQGRGVLRHVREASGQPSGALRRPGGEGLAGSHALHLSSLGSSGGGEGQGQMPRYLVDDIFMSL